MTKKQEMLKFVKEINQNEHGQYSSANVWFHLCNIAVIAAYLFICYHAAKLVPIPLEGITFFTLVVSGLITGNKLAHKFMNMKFGTTTPEKEEVIKDESGTTSRPV